MILSSLYITNKLHLVLNVVKEIRSHQHDQEHQVILDWLTPIDYASQQHDYINRRQPGTGQWLFMSEEFRVWLKASKQTLFCRGYPGAGKTFLTSIVIDHLQTASLQIDSSLKSSIQDEKIGLAFVYCDFMKRDQQKPVDILASLIRQLIRDQPSVPQVVKDLYEKYKKISASSPSNHDIRHFSEALQHVISGNYTRVFIVIDALDECQDTQTLLTEIFRVQGATEANIFATSRPKKEDIEKAFEGSLSLDISARDEDVKRYIDGRMSELKVLKEENMDLSEESKAELKAEVRDKVSEAVDGM
jgi:Cdc6-like AAA superfamily ATPase